MAVMAVNTEVSYHHEELLHVVQAKLWNRPYDGFELEG
jgi:hypothetical protein